MARALVELTVSLRGHDTITAADFQPAWIIVALISSTACFLFLRMPAETGAEIARRTVTPPGPTEAADQKL